jgi:ATP-dependent DNA ligase
MRVKIDGLAERHERKKRSGIILCYPFEEKRLARWGERTVFVQPKLNGERARLQWVQGYGWTFWSSTEESLNFAIPHLLENLKKSDLSHEVHFDGELYTHGLPFEEIHSRVSRTRELHPEHALIEYHIFDLAAPAIPQCQRFLLMKHFYSKLPEQFFHVEERAAENVEQIFSCLNEFVAQGYEGMVVRRATGLWVPRRSTELMKFKPKHRDTYDVIGAMQLRDKFGEPRPELGALICECDNRTFKVGTGFTSEQRKTIWETYLAQPELFSSRTFEAVVDYQNITGGKKGNSKGVPYCAVFVNLKVKGEYDE